MSAMNGTAGIRGKDDEKKLFVGRLPICTEDEIKQAFSKYGTIVSINIKKDLITGRPRGFGFIVFENASTIDTILQEAEIYVKGRLVDPRRVTALNSTGKLFVGGLTSEITDEHLREYFGKFGTITEIQWPYDKVRHRNKPYAFLTFEKQATVTELLRKPKQTVCGVELDVRKVKFNPETMRARGFIAAQAYAPAFYPGYDYYGYAYDPYEDPNAYDYYGGGYGPVVYTPAYEPCPPMAEWRQPPRRRDGVRTVTSHPRHAPY